jgi:lactoylglutathione lyase
LNVKVLDSGIEFYLSQLGLELIWKTQRAVGFSMSDDVTEIVLHCEPNAPEIELKVQSADEAANQFEQAGGKVVVPPFDIQIGRCVVVRDPWGNDLVVLDSSKGLLKTDSEDNVIRNTN